MLHSYLAANTEQGFCSLFGEMTNKTDYRIFLIKGGPGTGKSGFMKRVAKAAEDKGYDVEQIHCSSDPDSLDGIIIPNVKLIICDATAPHTVDPKYPGAVEQILPFGELWDSEKLVADREKIAGLTARIKDIFDGIYLLLSASGQVRAMMSQIIEHSFRPDKADAALDKALHQEAVLNGGKATPPERRIVSALSADGTTEYTDYFDICDRFIVLEDTYDTTHLWTAIAEQKVACHKRTILLNPLNVGQIDHIILPEHRLGIVSANSRIHPKIDNKSARIIHTKRAIEPKLQAAQKSQLQFGKKMCNSLYGKVCEMMASEKALHDELEQYYIHSMDFAALDAACDAFIRQFVENPAAV